MERRSRLSLLMIILLLLLSACDMSRDAQHDLEHPDEKLITEKLVIWWDEGIPHRLFAAEALEQRFANTRFEYHPFKPPPPQGLIPPNYMAPNLLEMMRSEPSPDLIVFDTRFLSLMIEAEYLDPIPDMYGLEIDYDIITEFRSIAPDLTLYALPLGRVAEGLFYNKAIFDEMRVPYPKDGMTWVEIMELAAALKSDRYKSIGIAVYDSLVSQLSLRLHDSGEERVDEDSEQWKRLMWILNTMKDFQEHHGVNDFLMSSFSVGDTAMVIGPVSGGKEFRPGLLSYESNLRLYDVDWDIVTFPVFDDGQRLQPASQMMGIGIPSRSENKEDAYKVMRYLLSHEAQLDNSRKGLISLRSDAEGFREEFGSSSLLAGKSVSSFFSESPRGVRDPVFEFVFYTNLTLQSNVSPAATIFRQHTAKLMNEREQFVEEMRSKF